MTHEIIDFFLEKGISVSTSAVVQMRDKLKAEAFRDLLLGFNKHISEHANRSINDLYRNINEPERS